MESVGHVLGDAPHTRLIRSSVEFLSAGAAPLPGDLRRAWREMDARNRNVYSMYQSLDWFEHLVATDRAPRTRVAVVHDDRGAVAGIVPLRSAAYPLRFATGRLRLGAFRLRTAFLLGGEPVLPEDGSLHERLFAAIWSHHPDLDAIYLKALPADGPCWRYLGGKGAPGLVNVEHGIRDLYSITLPRTFEAYLSGFRQKKRYNLKRQVKLLRDHGRGDLRLLRTETEGKVGAFLRDAADVRRHSWQGRMSPGETEYWNSAPRLTDLARRGFLRSYVLRAGGVPCAYVVGYQYRGTYHYSDVGYDERYAAYSPGSVLLFLLIEDLIAYRSPRILNFGIGDSAYKCQFATDSHREASVLLMRRTGANRLRYAANRLSHVLRRQARRVWPGAVTIDPSLAEVLERL
jgi:CelD/BcsL family acetyltransferase involved in cellulose biosynthesis